MVEGYLIETGGFKSFFGKTNYNLYIPSEKLLLGNFIYDEKEGEIDFNGSAELFLYSLDEEESSPIHKRVVEDKKFAFRREIQESSLEKMVECVEKIEGLKEEFHKNYLMLRDKLND